MAGLRAVAVPAVDDARLFGMRFELALTLDCSSTRAFDLQRALLFLAAAVVDHDIIRIALERAAGECPRLIQRIEHMMQEDVRQTVAKGDRRLAAYPALPWQSCPILQSRQAPSATARCKSSTHLQSVCLPDRVHHQFPIDGIEEAFDVEIEHPVIAPAPLSRHRQCIDAPTDPGRYP